MRRRTAAVGLILSLAACTEGAGPGGAPPEILSSVVAPNPGNVLSAVVTARLDAADSVAVRYAAAGEAEEVTTPAVTPVADSAVVPVLGLEAETEYALRVVAWGGRHEARGGALQLVTGPLPEDLPSFVAHGTDPSPGYLAFAAGLYGLVIDNTGRVVWYHRFPEGPGLNFQAQPTGRYTARPQVADPAPSPVWVEIDPLGETVRTLDCLNGLTPRFHDLVVEPDHSYWILCDEVRTMDLSQDGGQPDARVTGTVVQHVSAAGALLFEWSAFDHFDVGDLPLDARDGPLVNFTHGNALDLDAEGNLLLSFRSLDELTSIDTLTGGVNWRMGGPRNEFDFEGTADPGFARQHSVRVTGPGELLLLDNSGNGAGSRAERYTVDVAARKATLTASYGSDGVFALSGGTVQALPGGRILVTFGSASRVEEYDGAGNVVWWLEDPGYVFRAQRFESLYRPGVGAAR